MKKVQDIKDDLPWNQESCRKQKTTSNQSEGESRPIIDELFYKFALEYGQMWLSMIPTHTAKEAKKFSWQEGLAKYTDEMIRDAALKVMTNKQFPSLKEIAMYCEEQLQQSRYKPIEEVLSRIEEKPKTEEQKKASLEVYLHHREIINRALGRK